MTEESWPEESWEAEIGAMLGSLPEVDPPEGFLAVALDHRPLRAGRTLVSLALAVLVATAIGVVSEADGDRIIPAVDDLSERHLSAAALLGGRDDDAASGGSGRAETVDASRLLESYGYEQEALIDAGNLRQAVYASDAKVVSVFEFDGKVDWGRLPASGRVDLGERGAWLDEASGITIVGTTDGTLAIVGLEAEEVAGVVAQLPTGEPSLGRRAGDLAVTVARQLGFGT